MRTLCVTIMAAGLSLAANAAEPKSGRSAPVGAEHGNPVFGGWYICYHRRPIPSKGRDHRVVCIDRMEFDQDGGIKPVVMTSSGSRGQ